ncbi:MAG: endonuclease III [Acutalibacteraceae bacterium]|nr:endonuclease III [Acutalibacteraceae bacterium]
MTKKQIAVKAVEILKERYPDAICSLEYKDPFQLLVAVRLSAQCTDARVNMVTPSLFAEFPTAKAMADADIADIEKHIKSCGLYKTKAKDLKGIGEMLTEKYGGIVPDTIEELIKLPGVGRKTANLVCGDIYGKSAVVTDTHFIRITNRLGLVKTTVPVKVEQEMRALLPSDESNDFCHRIVLFGRDTCTARAPKCDECVLKEICKKQGIKK